MRTLIKIHALPSLAILGLISGCATPKAPLEKSQFVDDGVDYYSAKIDNDDGNLIYSEQWITDENGDRIYTLNSHQSIGSNRLYVGDIRTVSDATEPNRLPDLNRNGEPIPRVRVYGGSIIERNDDSLNRGYNSPYGYRSSPVFNSPPLSAPPGDQTADTPPAPQPVSPPAPVVNPTTGNRSRSGQNRTRHRRAVLRTPPRSSAPKKSPASSLD